MNIYTFSLWGLRALDSLFLHTILVTHFPKLPTSLKLEPTPSLPLVCSSLTYYYSLRIKATARELSASPSSTSKCLYTFSLKRCLDFSESNTSTHSPNLFPCLPQHQSYLFSWAYIFSSSLICNFHKT